MTSRSSGRQRYRFRWAGRTRRLRWTTSDWPPLVHLDWRRSWTCRRARKHTLNTQFWVSCVTPPVYLINKIPERALWWLLKDISAVFLIEKSKDMTNWFAHWNASFLQVCFQELTTRFQCRPSKEPWRGSRLLSLAAQVSPHQPAWAALWGSTHLYSSMTTFQIQKQITGTQRGLWIIFKMIGGSHMEVKHWINSVEIHNSLNVQMWFSTQTVLRSENHIWICGDLNRKAKTD